MREGERIMRKGEGEGEEEESRQQGRGRKRRKEGSSLTGSRSSTCSLNFRSNTV